MESDLATGLIFIQSAVWVIIDSMRRIFADFARPNELAHQFPRMVVTGCMRRIICTVLNSRTRFVAAQQQGVRRTRQVQS
jgi:hypothetical protein